MERLANKCKTYMAIREELKKKGEFTPPSGPFDFGQEKDVGLCTKLIGTDVHDPNCTWENFGHYAGQDIDGKHCVIVYTTATGVGDVAVFDTIGELKMKWQLD